MIFTTLSGITYRYDLFSNRIDMLENQLPVEKEYPIRYAPIEAIHSLPLLDTFVIELTRECNLRCSYCCYSGDYRHTRTHEHTSLAKNQVDEILNFIRLNHRQKPIYIGFYGGEPLLKFPIIQCFVKKAESIWREEVSFILSTNGILLNAERTNWLVEHQFRINISLDGGKFHHDKHRKTKTGIGSFDAVYRNLLSIKQIYPLYFQENVNLLMTIENVLAVKNIAEEWQSDSLLFDKAPDHISGLAPNYAKGVKPVDEQQLKQTLYALFDFYKSHPENVVLKTFFNEKIEDLKLRPLFDLLDENKMSTCLPENKKCFIDVYGKVGVCEKMCDSYRIGNIQKGFDYELINDIVQKMAMIRRQYCSACEIVRLCDTCLLALDLDDKEFAMNCHNQCVVTKCYMLIMCELAEEGLL
jgi:uncharacterized protein